MGLLFPPAEALPPQPGSVSDDISFVHQVLQGTERLEDVRNENVSAPAGILTVDGPTVPDTKYWYVFACSAQHDDGTARRLFISMIHDGAIRVAIMDAANSGAVQPQNVPLAVPRAFLLPPRSNLRADVTVIGGANILNLRYIYLELDLGEPHPGLS